MEPQPNKPQVDPSEVPEDQAAGSTSAAEITTPDMSSPELTAQVDDLMATSAAATTPAEAPLASTVITPNESTPPSSFVEPEITQPEASPAPVAESPVETPDGAGAETVPEVASTPNEPVTLPTYAAAPAPETTAAPILAPAPESFAPSDAQPAAVPAPSQRSWLKVVLWVLVILIGLAAVSAAVYAEVIVPNQPQNVLMKAFENSVQQKQVSYKGSLNIDSNGTAAKVDFNGAQDNDTSASELQLTVTVSGITLPVEARLVDKNVYVKVGDLKPIVTLLGVYGDVSTAKQLNAISQQLSNKWVSIDSTLLKQASVGCFTNTKFTLTQADVKLLEDQYKAHPFATIQSTANDTVNGQKVVKYQLSIDDDTAVTYGNNVHNLSLIQALNKCRKTPNSSTSSSLRDHNKTPLTVWVDKGSKQILQIASESTSQDAGKGVKGSGKVTFNYGSVSIVAPTDSTPVLEVLANIEKATGLPNTTNQGLNLSGLLGSQVGGSLNR